MRSFVGLVASANSGNKNNYNLKDKNKCVEDEAHFLRLNIAHCAHQCVLHGFQTLGRLKLVLRDNKT